MVEEKEREKTNGRKRCVNIGFRYCIRCGMDTVHVIHDDIVPDGVMCSMCNTCFVYDDMSGLEFEYAEKNFDK